jgi:hypothetical protein
MEYKFTNFINFKFIFELHFHLPCLGDADRVLADRALVLDLDLGDAESADLVRRGTLVASCVYLHKRAGSLHWGDRLVTLHLQGRTNAIATGLD